jgi:hypothetical protein
VACPATGKQNFIHRQGTKLIIYFTYHFILVILERMAQNRHCGATFLLQ